MSGWMVPVWEIREVDGGERTSNQRRSLELQK
jgi:hypothetical protein